MSSDWQAELDRAVDRRFEQLVAVRRHIHAHPEPSGEELQTSLYLYTMLDNEGFQVRIGPEGRGVLADIQAPTAERRMGLRADIDALRIHDQKTVAYRSKRSGVMHACGHDAHAATVLGAMLALRDAQQYLPWPVQYRGIFQPSEETGTGAAEMIGAGALDSVAAVLATHMDPSRVVGRIGLKAGVLTANCDSMRFCIIGRGGHAARPHESIDPIAAAAQLINSVYLFVPRATDSQDAVVVTIGQIHGGDNPNVIPEQVELQGTLRTLDAAVRQRTIEHIRQLARGLGETSGTSIDVQFDTSTASVRNDHDLTELVWQAASGVVGPERLDAIPRPSMGSEDFSAYLADVPGAMFRLGSAAPNAGKTALHTPTFDIDEQAIAIGAKTMARTVVLWSDPDRRPEKIFL